MENLTEVKRNIQLEQCNETLKYTLQFLTKGTALEGSKLGLGAVEYM